jgi:hypothetical protein
VRSVSWDSLIERFGMSLFGQKDLRTKPRMRLKIDGRAYCYTAAYLHEGVGLHNRECARF